MARWIPPKPQFASSPLFHRYQPQGCMANPNQKKCLKSFRTPLYAYLVEWEDNFGERWREKIFKTSKDSSNFTKVCFFGWSHSRNLVVAFMKLGFGKLVEHIQVKYPEDVDAALLNHSYNEVGCRALVIAVAQWPGSGNDGRSAYLFDQFYAGMREIVQTAFDLFADHANDVRIYMRSIHEIPIGEETGSCPMSDWRSPVVMDGYNHLVEKAVKEIQERHTVAKQSIQFLDTSFVTSPMWDSAPDWGHFPPQVSDEEAIYIASVVIGNN